MLSLSDQYQIDLPCHPGVNISCRGSWPNNFQLTQSGPTGAFAAASVTKQILTISDVYDVSPSTF
jgi:hypothetical protein